MSAEVRDSKTGKMATDAAAAVARGVDQHLKDYTGRSSEAWLDDGARLIKDHPWKAVAAIAVVAYLFGKLRG
jgi:ElaB/YqjD/DUF883 family membrane-anchored ribosome-binding protein